MSIKRYEQFSQTYGCNNLSKSFVICRAWVGNMKQRVPNTSKFSNFKGETQCYVVKLPKAGAGQYCPKIPRVPGTRGTRINSSLDMYFLLPSPFSNNGSLILTRHFTFQAYFRSLYCTPLARVTLAQMKGWD